MNHSIHSFNDSYRFLNNFYSSPILYQEKIYPTAEHLYQALKTKDQDIRNRIRLTISPGRAKRKGQSIPLRKDWERVKDKLMYMVIRLKFLQNPKLAQRLLRTGSRPLIEGNHWHDNYWGNCICPQCQSIFGKNQLGKTLMKVRRML